MASLTDFKLPSQGQHERIFLEDVIKRYKTRLLTAAGYIYSICRIYRAEGHKLNIPKPKLFYEYFGIPKSTFYRALTQLENTPDIHFRWEPIGGISMWVEPAAASVEPAAAEPAAASVEPAAASVEPAAASVEPAAAEPAAASVEPAAASVEPQRFNQIPPLLRGDFEAFVRSQWKKVKGEDIHYFHRFIQKPVDFRAWWEKFKSRSKPCLQSPTNEIESVNTYRFTDEDRVPPERIRALRQFLASKK